MGVGFCRADLDEDREKLSLSNSWGPLKRPSWGGATAVMERYTGASVKVLAGCLLTSDEDVSWKALEGGARGFGKCLEKDSSSNEGVGDPGMDSSLLLLSIFVRKFIEGQVG